MSRDLKMGGSSCRQATPFRNRRWSGNVEPLRSPHFSMPERITVGTKAGFASSILHYDR
jgi:hypothetical protein